MSWFIVWNLRELGMTMDGTKSESERRQAEADELEFKPGPVPPLHPVDRYGFVKAASPGEGTPQRRPKSDRERFVLLMPGECLWAIEQLAFRGNMTLEVVFLYEHFASLPTFASECTSHRSVLDMV